MVVVFFRVESGSLRMVIQGDQEYEILSQDGLSQGKYRSSFNLKAYQ